MATCQHFCKLSQDGQHSPSSMTWCRQGRVESPSAPHIDRTCMNATLFITASCTKSRLDCNTAQHSTAQWQQAPLGLLLRRAQRGTASHTAASPQHTHRWQSWGCQPAAAQGPPRRADNVAAADPHPPTHMAILSAGNGMSSVHPAYDLCMMQPMHRVPLGHLQDLTREPHADANSDAVCKLPSALLMQKPSTDVGALHGRIMQCLSGSRRKELVI